MRTSAWALLLAGLLLVGCAAETESEEELGEIDSALSGATGTCRASFYGPGFHGHRTANGEIFNQNALTAARQTRLARTFPFGARVRVTNVESGDAVVVRVNDTGPLRPGRCLDLSQGAFERIAPLSQGVARIRYEVLD